ncbi:MAG TPA: hypothetical protein VM221_05045 [Armatimonadota bacterium]|nr:hypothetical protein [Armatimonadota bacterium]
MRRYACVTWISLIVVIAAAAFLILVPIAHLRRESLIFEGGERARRKDKALIERQARQRPSDAQAWLALALRTSWAATDSVRVNEDAFSRVFKLSPEWAAPHLMLGAMLATRVPLGRYDELAGVYPERAALARPWAKPLTPEQRRVIAKAPDALRQARSLDPNNAAPDYLLAYLALAEHRDGHATAFLSAALTKNHWGLGQREAQIALYEAYARALPGLSATVEADLMSYRALGASRAFRELAWLLTAMAVEAQRRGEVERAVFLRRCVLHLGRLLMAEGYTATDAMLGSALWSIGASDALTPAELAAVEAKLGPSGPDLTDRERSRRARLLRRARQAKLEVYLRDHGRPDMAEEIASARPTLEKWRQELSAAIKRENSFFVWYTALARLADALTFVLAAGGWLALGGVAYLFAWATRAWSRSARWATQIRGLAIGFVLVAAAFLGGALSSERPAYLRVISESDWPAFAAGAGLPLLAVIMVVVGWLRRRKRAREQLPEFFAQCTGALAVVLLVVSAGSVVYASALWLPYRTATTRYIQERKKITYQGELAYLGLEPPTAAVEGIRDGRGEGTAGGGISSKR